MINLPVDGHLNPALEIARELARRGERVLAYAPERMSSRVREVGAQFRAFPYEWNTVGSNLVGDSTWQLRTAAACLPQLAAESADEHVDYVIVDYLCAWGRLLAQHLSLPSVVVHSTTPLAFSALARIPGRLITLLDLRLSPQRWRRFREFQHLAAELASRWDVERLEHPIQLVLPRYGELHLVTTSALLHADSKGPDPRYRFIGPCIRPAGVMTGDPLPPLTSDPLVYVSLGTLHNDRPEFYRACIRAYERAAFQVLINVGHRVDLRAFEPLPPHIHVVRHVDQIEVLNRAAVFVTHGGMNGLCEALLAGVPMLVYPQMADQYVAAKYVARSGAGLFLGFMRPRPTRLLGLTQRLIEEPEFRHRCREIGARLGAERGARAAADLILQFRDDLCVRRTCGHPVPARAEAERSSRRPIRVLDIRRRHRLSRNPWR